MGEQPGLLILRPDELLFSNVRLGQAYCQTLTVSNPSRANVEATLRAGSSDRYTVSPSSIVLKPQQSIEVDVRLRVLKYAQKQKAVQIGQRDIFHIKAAYFEQKFYATFLLDPTEAAPAATKPSSRHASRFAVSKSPQHSPRDRVGAQNSHLSPHVSSRPQAGTGSAAASFPPQSKTAQGESAQAPNAAFAPDLSPRALDETDDPPTPRMCKAIAPTAPRLVQGPTSLRPQSSQMVLHQGHFGHDSPCSRPSSPKGSMQQLEAAHQHELQHLNARLREQDAVISTLHSQLADARHRTNVDKRAAKPSSSPDMSSMSLQAQSQLERLQAANVELEGCNAELRDRLHELGDQLQAAKADQDALQRLQGSLQNAAGPSADALVDAAVARERGAQDTRNRKVLELLNNKDEVIQRFEDRCTEANAEIQQLKMQLQEASKQLETTEGRLASTVDSRNKLRKQLEAQHSAAASVQASLKAEAEVLKDRLHEAVSSLNAKAAAPASPEKSKLATQLRAELEVHKDALAASKEETAALADSLEKASGMIEELNAQMASKDAQLECQQEQCQVKDSELDSLAQQLKQLQAAAEAQSQAQAQTEAEVQANDAKAEQSRKDWAVNVSLDQGMGPAEEGQMLMLPTSPTALRARVQTLEVANEQLEKALMAAQQQHLQPHPPTAQADQGMAVLEATVSSLRSMLLDREQQLGKLEADLAVACSSSGCSQRLMTEAAQNDSALRIELNVLKRRLSEKEAQIISSEERLSHLEAVHRVAQETVLRSEAQLEATRRSLMELDEDTQAGKEEAESARALALRLNARVSELSLAAECARSDGETARAELDQVRASHQKEIDALEKRQRQLVTALKAVGGQTGPLHLDGGSETQPYSAGAEASAEAQYDRGAGLMQPSRALLAVRDKNQSEAIQEAELAAGVMQAKLLEGLAGEREANRLLQEARYAFDAERAQLELNIQRAKHEGAVRIQTLEDTVRKLGSRSDLHQEIARLGGEASFLRRGESRLKSDLSFAEERCNELQREVTILRQQVASFEASEHEAQVLNEVQRSVTGDSSCAGSIAAKMGEISRELSMEGSQPHIVARLVERAEASEMQLAQAQQQLQALKQTATARAAAGGAGTSAAISAAHVMETRTGNLQRQLLIAQSDLKAVKEDAHLQEVAKAQLEAQLAGAAREVAAAQARVAEKQRLQYDRHQVHQQDDTAASWREAAQSARQLADAVRAAESAQAAHQEAQQALRVSLLETARLKAGLETSSKSHKRAQQAWAQKAEHAQHELRVAKRECERSAGDAEDRRVQLSVLVETVETLQAGNVGEKEQRIVSLTAQLTTAYMKQAVAERRASELQCELEGQTAQLHKGQSEQDKLQHSVSELELEVSTAKAATESVKKEAWALRGELKAHAETAVKVAWEVDEARSLAAKAEADAAGLRAALEAARSRHFEQLARERNDAAASQRQAQAGALTVPTPNLEALDSSSAQALALSAQHNSLATGIEELVAALKPHRESTEGSRSEDELVMNAGDDDMPYRVVRRMKALLLQAQAQQAKAEADHRIAAAETAALISNIGPLEMALEARTCERDAAVAALQTTEVIAAKRQAQGSAHAEQQASLQTERLAALQDQLRQAKAHALELDLAVKHANAQHSGLKWQKDDLQGKLAACKGDIRELESRLSAAHMESAGSADTDRSQSVEAAIQQRDSDLRAYFDTEVLKHILNPDHQKRSLALTREICGLKLAHQQLIASQAAAKKCANAASLQSTTLKQQLQAFEEKQKVLEDARASFSGSPESHAASVSELSAQLAQKAAEIHCLREEVLQKRHQLANQDITVQELHAAVQGAKNAAQHAQDNGHRAVEQAKQALTVDFALERTALLRELESSKHNMQEAKQAFTRDMESLRQQSEGALDARPFVEQYNEVVDAANAAQEHVQQLETEAGHLHQENQQLRSAVQQLEVELTELKADAETRDSALESLQDTLTKIERSIGQGQNRATSPLTGGARRGAAGKASLGSRELGQADGTLAALSRQLVQAKMAEADAQRKHRVSARAEVSLRQRLSQREDRIAELKNILASLQHGHHHHAASDRHGPSPLSSPRDHYHSTYHHTQFPQPRIDTHHTAQQSPRQHEPGAQLPSTSPTASSALASQQLHDAQAAGGQQSIGPRAPAPVHVARLPYFQQHPHQSSAASQAKGGLDRQADVNRGDEDRDLHASSPHPPIGAIVRPPTRPTRSNTSPVRLAEQITDLKIELARRDADVQYLESQLAQANAASRPVERPAPHFDEDSAVLQQQVHGAEASLGQLRQECERAVATAQAMMGRPTAPRGSPRTSEDGAGLCDVEYAVRQLVAKLKERDASIKKLKAVVKATAETASKERAAAAAQPMEASQRAVIRDLSLRVANLTRLNNQLKEERERAQERLRTLRASLGSAKLPQAPGAQPGQGQGCVRTPQRPRGTKVSQLASSVPCSTSLGHTALTVHQSGAAAYSSSAADHAVDSRNGSNGPDKGQLLECQAVQGLCQLLEHHVAVLEQSQEPLSSLLQPADDQSNNETQQLLLASSDMLVSQGARQALAAATVMTSAEVSAMRSTLQVLASHLTALQSGKKPPSSEDADRNELLRTDSESALEAEHSPRQPILALLPPAPKQHHKEAAAQTLMIPSLSTEASSSQDDVVAEQVQQASDRAQKWKGRCAKLRQDLLQTQTAAASLQAALNERLTHVEKATEELTRQHDRELSQLQAALDTAQAARQQLAEQQAQHSCSSQTDVQAAQANQAEAQARAAALQSQVDTLKAQSAASRSGLQEEANSLKAALAKEKSERVRIVLSLRDTITGLKQAGDVEGRLKADLVNTHDQLAAAQVAQETAEAKLAQQRGVVKELLSKLDSAQRQLSEHTAQAELKSHQTSLTASHQQQHIDSLEGQLKDTMLQGSQLTAKLRSLEAELDASKCNNGAMRREASQLEESNAEFRAKCQQLQDSIKDLSQERRDGMSAKWEALLRCRRHRAAVQHLQADLQAVESEKRSLEEELGRVRLKSQRASAEADKLQKKVDDLQHVSELERQQLAERQVSMMSELEKRMEEERTALKQEAAAMAASAAAAGEDKARADLSARLNSAQQSAFQDITNISNERRQLVDELEGLRSQFKAYQRVKAREISSLDHRVRILLHSQAVAGTMRPDDLPAQHAAAPRSAKKATSTRHAKPVMVPSNDSTAGSDAGTNGASDTEDTFPASYQPPLAGLKGKVQCASLTAAAEVGMALESEAVASALREAEYERVQREGAEAGVAALQDTLDKLKQKLKATQKELRATQNVASTGAAQAANAEATREGLQQIQEQLQVSQEALKAAKAESARRLKALQSLQQQGSEGPHLVANAAFLAEKTAREGTEGKLATARRSLAHKDELIKSLKTKVDELEAAVRAAKLADQSIEMQAAESRIRSLQASLSRKEDTIRDHKDRLDQAVRHASQAGAEEEAERQQVTVKRLKGDVVRKEGMLKATQAELDKVRQEASDAGKPARHTQQVSSSLALVQARAREVLPALKALAKLALRSAAAMHTAAGSLHHAMQPPSTQEELGAADVARMVDMPLAEVADLLGQGTDNSPVANDAAVLAQEVVTVLVQLEAALCIVSPGGKEGRVSLEQQPGPSREQWDAESLQDMLAGLQHQAARAEAALADAVSASTSPQSSSSNCIAAQHSKRRRKACANPVTRLEEDLLRASHGIEAELYEGLNL